jgi:plastocyanin
VNKLNRGSLAVIIIIIVIIIAGVYLYSTQNVQAPTNQSGVNGSANNTTNTNNTVASVITIQNGAFSPNNLTVKTGTNVQWINNDNTTHQVISDSGAFQSPVLGNGGVYNFYFAKSGVFGYHCEIHPAETGTITITP